MKTNVLGFFTEQLGNGTLSRSTTRLIFVIGWLCLFGMAWWMMIHDKVDLGLLALIGGYITGNKIYQKIQEIKSTVDTPPVAPCEQTIKEGQ